MPTTNNFRKILHRKQWSQCALTVSANNAAGQFSVKSRLADQLVYSLRSNISLDVYSITEDGWGTMPSPALSTFAAGACGEFSPIGPSGTATAGSTTTLTTNLTLATDLRGYEILITGGPGAGDVRTIASNTIGTNGVITVTSAFSATITASSTYTLRTGRLYMFGGGTLAAATFRVFDFATMAYTSLSITGLPATFGTDGMLIGTPSIESRGVVNAFATGTATSATSTTLVNSGKAWATNQWANSCQVRITGGTGAGQTRIVSSNTGTTITVSSAWTTTPDATSTYSIEGNDDYLYLLGNSALTLYRYSISGNTWSTLTPGVARAAGAFAGLTASWVAQNPNTDWMSENAIINGRRIYSFRGGGSTVLDYYDIASNAWTNGLTYGPLSIAPSTGWQCIDYQGKLYIRNLANTNSQSQWYVFDTAKQQMVPWNSQPILVNALVVGERSFVGEYADGATVIPFLYTMVENTTFNMMLRSVLL